MCPGQWGRRSSRPDIVLYELFQQHDNFCQDSIWDRQSLSSRHVRLRHFAAGVIAPMELAVMQMSSLSCLGC
jgi:hypothetical protein